MLILIFAAVIAILLSLSRRNFGIFTLTLLAGLAVNNYWNKPITDLIVAGGLNVPFTTLSGIVGLALICTPATMVLVKSVKNNNWITGIISSILVTIFLVLVILPSFSNIFTLDALSLNIGRQLLAWSNWIILAGFIFAILDVLSFRVKK